MRRYGALSARAVRTDAARLRTGKEGVATVRARTARGELRMPVEVSGPGRAIRRSPLKPPPAPSMPGTRCNRRRPHWCRQPHADGRRDRGRQQRFQYPARHPPRDGREPPWSPCHYCKEASQPRAGSAAAGRRPASTTQAFSGNDSRGHSNGKESGAASPRNDRCEREKFN